MAPDTPNARARLSRRRILQGATWAVPAVLVASAAPASAASASMQLAVTIYNQSRATLRLADSTVGGTGAVPSYLWGFQHSRTGDEYPATLSVAVRFPTAALRDPLALRAKASGLWERTVSTSGTFTVLTYTFPAANAGNLQYGIPTIDDNVASNPAFRDSFSVEVLATGVSNQGNSFNHAFGMLFPAG